MNSTRQEFCGGLVADTGRRTGRRPGASTTKAAIEKAARRQFSELGYDRTSMRQVAIEAGVDPALVSHYFGSKQQLFSVVAELPVDPDEVLPRIIAGDLDGVGLRLAQFALGVLETEQGRSRFTSLLRAAASEAAAAAEIRERLTRELLTPLAARIGSDNAAYRGSLLMSQIAGLTFARYIVKIEPLASAPADVVARDLGPNLQRYLTGDISHLPGAAGG
jgi:AcrR family transcriptional regulator